MNSMKEYCKKMTTEQLQTILRQHCNGVLNISTDAVLQICEILADRAPNKVDAQEAFRRFCKYYLSEQNDL